MRALCGLLIDNTPTFCTRPNNHTGACAVEPPRAAVTDVGPWIAGELNDARDDGELWAGWHRFRLLNGERSAVHVGTELYIDFDEWGEPDA